MARGKFERKRENKNMEETVMENNVNVDDQKDLPAQEETDQESKKGFSLAGLKDGAKSVVSSKPFKIAAAIVIGVGAAAAGFAAGQRTGHGENDEEDYIDTDFSDEEDIEE